MKDIQLIKLLSQNTPNPIERRVVCGLELQGVEIFIEIIIPNN